MSCAATDPAHMVTVREAGHQVLLDNPRGFLEAVSQFLAENPDGSCPAWRWPHEHAARPRQSPCPEEDDDEIPQATCGASGSHWWAVRL
jgi:hypothetical protein